MTEKKLLRIIVPAYPPFNIYTGFARTTTAAGPVMIASAVNQLPNWRAEIIDENNCRNRNCPKNKSEQIDHLALQEHEPADVIGFYGSLSSTMPRVYQLAALYKKMGLPTIAGGSHVSKMPEEAVCNNIDFVVINEGEETIIELLRHLDSQELPEKIAGLAFLKDGKVFFTATRTAKLDLSELPLPDFNLVRFAKIKTFPISWWQGCPYNCEFCAVKGKPRCSSASRLYNVVKHLAITQKARRFFIVDDHFGGNHANDTHRQAAIRFCRYIARFQKITGIKLSFTCQIRLSSYNYPDLLTAMREANIDHLCIGYESPIDEDLAAMRKGYRASDMIERTKILRNYGFLIHGMFIFGYPARPEFKEDFTETLSLDEKVCRFKKFIKDAKLDTVQILLTVPLPGTELRDRLAQAGRIYGLKDFGWEYYDGQFPLFVPDDGVQPEELQNAVVTIMKWFYNLRTAWKLPQNFLIHFPRLVFGPALTFRFRQVKKSFRLWRKKYFRNQSIKVAGHFIVMNWLKSRQVQDFKKKLQQMKQKLN